MLYMLLVPVSVLRLGCRLPQRQWPGQSVPVAAVGQCDVAAFHIRVTTMPQSDRPYRRFLIEAFVGWNLIEITLIWSR